MTRVSRDYVDIRQTRKTLQQTRAMGMQLRRKNFGARVAPSKQGSLAAGSSTTIKNRRINDRSIRDRLSTTGQQRDQLRSFILNGYAAFLTGARSGYIARKNASCRR